MGTNRGTDIRFEGECAEKGMPVLSTLITRKEEKRRKEEKKSRRIERLKHLLGKVVKRQSGKEAKR